LCQHQRSLHYHHHHQDHCTYLLSKNLIYEEKTRQAGGKAEGPRIRRGAFRDLNEKKHEKERRLLIFHRANLSP
jgi:hypothetical protein